MVENDEKPVVNIDDLDEYRETEPPSQAIFDLLDEMFEDDLIEKPPMARTVDLEAVDSFFEGDGARSLSFEYSDVQVTVVRKGEKRQIVVD